MEVYIEGRLYMDENALFFWKYISIFLDLLLLLFSWVVNRYNFNPTTGMAILDQWWTSLTAYPNIVGLTVGTTLINGSLQTTVFWICLKICLLYIIVEFNNINEHKNLCNVYGSMIFSLQEDQWKTVLSTIWLIFVITSGKSGTLWWFWRVWALFSTNKISCSLLLCLH